MKATILCLAVLCATHFLAHAESPYDRELKQLTEQREKEFAAASVPINRQYRAALEKLLLTATVNRDYAAAGKINEELKAMGDGGVGGTATPVQTNLGTRIETLLAGTTWVHDGRFHYKFARGGGVSLVEPHPKGHYKINGETGFVSFEWEKNQFPGEGMQFDPKTETFTHNRGGLLVPAK